MPFSLWDLTTNGYLLDFAAILSETSALIVTVSHLRDKVWLLNVRSHENQALESFTHYLKNNNFSSCCSGSSKSSSLLENSLPVKFWDIWSRIEVMMDQRSQMKFSLNCICMYVCISKSIFYFFNTLNTLISIIKYGLNWQHFANI